MNARRSAPAARLRATVLAAAVSCAAQWPLAHAAAAEQAPAFRETRLDGCVAEVRAPDFPEVGAAIPCEIRLRADAGAQLDPSSVSVLTRPDTLGVFDVLSLSQPRAETGADGTVFVVIDLVIATLDAGTQTPEPLSLAFGIGNERREGRVEFPSFPVKSLVGEQPDPAKYRDIRGEIDIPEPLDWRTIALWTLGALLALLAVVAAVLALRRRSARKLEPDAWALAALASLEARQLPSRGDFAPFYDELTHIVRKYASLRFAIPAEVQTTREFLRSAGADGGFPAEERGRLEQLLRLADLVKFASARPEATGCAAHLADARAFVAATRPRPDARPGVAGALPAKGGGA